MHVDDRAHDREAETAPAAASRDMFLDAQGNLDHEKEYFSPQAAGVPGTVAGLLYALEKYGTLSGAARAANHAMTGASMRHGSFFLGLLSSLSLIACGGDAALELRAELRRERRRRVEDQPAVAEPGAHVSRRIWVIGLLTLGLLTAFFLLIMIGTEAQRMNLGPGPTVQIMQYTLPMALAFSIPAASLFAVEPAQTEIGRAHV